LSARSFEEPLDLDRPPRVVLAPPARIAVARDPGRWTPVPDVAGSPGSEIFFLARNGHGLGIRLTRGAAAILSGAASRFAGASDPLRSIRLRACVLRGTSRDRLEILADEYVARVLLPRVTTAHRSEIASFRDAGRGVILATHLLGPVARRFAQQLGCESYEAPELEFRDDLATGRVLAPVRRPVAPPDTAAPRAIFGDAGAPPLSVRDALAGRTILVVGGTGFIGKVFVAKLLHDLPEVGRVVVLVRPRGGTGALERFAEIVDRSPVFDVFRELHGPELPAFLREKVRVVEGDVCHPHLGNASAAAELRECVDLVINCSGLTEFNPDPKLALETNVDSTLHLVEFVRSSRRAALLHISTCFVAGSREGRIEERVQRGTAPLRGLALDPEEERERLLEAIRARDREAPLQRAKELGWPNLYTYTKGLAEAFLEARAADLPVSIVRPSIVESARSFPFRGWNEGINTSAPLSYVLGTWFRQLPVRERKALDVVPVDDTVRGMILVAAALVERRAPRVVQLATSVTRPLTMRRAVELTALAHRRHYVAESGFRSWALARFEAIPVSRSRYERFSIPAQAGVLRALNRLLGPLSGGPRGLRRLERSLSRVRKLIELYEPFILRDEHAFEADEIERLSAALVSDEIEKFGYDVAGIDWTHYWTQVHIPGLRRWSYPLIEGKEPVARARRDRGASAGFPAAERRIIEAAAENGSAP
jgi:long-chain acyl-CoA synthetase